MSAYDQPRRVNVERMRKVRNRFGIQYERHSFDRRFLAEIDSDEWQVILAELVEAFRVKMRAKYLWSGWKPEVLTLYRDYDVVFDLERMTMETRLVRVAR